MPPDIRWQQRFANFCQALDQLETFFQPPALNERERQGLIKAFEYCFDLGWPSGWGLFATERPGWPWCRTAISPVTRTTASLLSR